jgi:thiol-disulfide isomerase/thioredoxin
MLEVYVAPGCDACDYARELAQRASRAFEGIEVAVIDIEASEHQPPPAVFAVPSFLLDGVVLSLGNPSWERLRDALSESGRSEA